MAAVPQIELISRRRCHLCDEAQKLLESIRRDQPFQYQVLDVDSDPGLHLYYTHRVPVLRINGREVAELTFAEDAVREHLRRVSQ